jgi:hypothetical protein
MFRNNSLRHRQVEFFIKFLLRFRHAPLHDEGLKCFPIKNGSGSKLLTHATMLKQNRVYLMQAMFRASLAALSPRESTFLITISLVIPPLVI